MADKRRHRNNKNKRIIERYEPQGDEKVLSTPIEQLSLFDKTYNALKAGNINTVRDLMRFRASEMFRVQNIGKKSIMELERKLATLGVKFREEKLPEEQAEKEINNNNNNREPQSNEHKVAKQPERKKRDDRREQRQQPVNERKEKKAKQIPFEKRQFNKSEPIDENSLIKFNRNGKWGFKDWKNNVVIEPKWDEAFSFKDDAACVESGGLYGYIDRKGEVIIPCQFEVAMSFSEGYAVVSKDDKNGYIDKSGNLIIDYKYDIATPFCDGRALVKVDDKWGFVTPDGTLTAK